WDGGARVAHLRGRVDQPTDRQRAEEVANAAVGTTGKVLNEVTIKGLNEKTAGLLDGDIRSSLKKMVDNDPVLRDRSITFDVNNGAVTVKGDVQSADEKAKLTQLVEAAPGVKDFVNAVEIKPKSGAGGRRHAGRFTAGRPDGWPPTRGWARWRTRRRRCRRPRAPGSPACATSTTAACRASAASVRRRASATSRRTAARSATRP